MADETTPSREQIARRAYELYLARGCEPGKEVEDWLAAEKELILEREFGARAKRLPKSSGAKAAATGGNPPA